jgi:hypothetical protein
MTAAALAARKRARSVKHAKPAWGEAVVDLTDSLQNGGQTDSQDGAARAPALSGSNSKRGAAAPTSGAPTIVWGKRGENKWQAMCPVCGPVCVGANHSASDPPPQDQDEGAAAMLMPTVTLA